MLYNNNAYVDINYMSMRVLSNDGAVEEAEYLTSARIKNSVSGIRGNSL